MVAIKNQNTADDSFAQLTLQTGDTDIAQDDVMGQINFQAHQMRVLVLDAILAGVHLYNNI